MRTWNTVETFQKDQFTVEIAWCYEDLPLSEVFETEEEIETHQKRCEDYTDTHYVCRVRALYEGNEMGSDYLGSCYALGCSPDEDIQNGIGGQREDMIKNAVAEAQSACLQMLESLKKSFVAVDTDNA